MKNKVKINVDKLVCSLKCPQQTYDYLSNTKVGSRLAFDGFSLLIIKSEEDENDVTTQITAKCILDNDITIGTLTLNKTQFNGLAFFSFENKALYTLDGYTLDGKKVNYMFYLTWICDILGLTWKSFTTIEISVDSNHNTQRRLKQLMRHNDYDVYVNRQKHEDKKEVIKRAGAISPINCMGLLPNHTLYFQSAKKDIVLKFYNKTKEIETSDKYYIQNWNDMKSVWRMEVTIKWPKFKAWLEEINTNPNYQFPDTWKRFISPNEGQPHVSPSEPIEEYLERIFLLLQDEQFLAVTFDYFSEKVLYLKNKKEKWSLLDITYSYN